MSAAPTHIPTGFYYDTEFGEDSSSLMQKPPQELYAEYVAFHTGNSHSSSGGSSSNSLHAGNKSTQLPQFHHHEALYASTAVLLNKTKSEVEEYAKDMGALDLVADLPAPADVRRAVARMFADPKCAELIAEKEFKKKDEAYQVSREIFGEKLAAHLKREKEVLQKELQQYSSK